MLYICAYYYESATTWIAKCFDRVMSENKNLKQNSDNMNRKFVIDKEINLIEYDYLKTKIYSDNLTSIINNTDNDKVFTVGLFGSWGTGKSSIVETTRQEVETSNDKIKFITYDAWQYVNDSFRRMFLRKLREELKYEETDLMKKFYENESTDVGETYKFNWNNIPISIIVLLILFLCAIGSIFIVGANAWRAGLTISAIISFVSLMYAAFQGFFLKLKISVTKPHLFAPEQFEECFKEIVSNSLQKPNTILKWIKGDNSVQNLEKLVIVIDNIDRCSNDVAYELLTDIKTFLSTEPYSIVFVIPVDDDALRKHIVNSNRNSSDSSREKEEFLRKFFNVTIRIKPYEETDMFAFAKQISEKNNLNLKPETINLASKEYAKNPRRVIQLFNNLLAELNYYDAEFVQQNETLICCVLIVREEYPDYYNNIINSPKLFIDKKVPKDTSSEEEVKRFIRIAHSTLEKSELANLSRILTNSYSQFDDIASDLKDSIQTFEAKKVLLNWETDKERIVDYIVDRLENALKNQLVDTELVDYFDLIGEINKQFPLDKHLAKRIDEKVMPYLSTIIPKSKNHDNLCVYASNRHNQGNSSIKDTLIQNSQRLTDVDEENHWQSLFSAVLKVFNDKKTSTALSSTYTKYSQVVEDIGFSSSQFNFLISDEFVQQKISELPVDEQRKEIIFDVNTKEYQEVKRLFENKKNISEEAYVFLLVHIVGANNPTKMKDRTIDDIAKILKFSNPLLNLIPKGKLKTQPKTLYDLIVKDRLSVPKSPYTNNPNIRNNSQYYTTQYYTTANFIDECINADKYIQDIIDFVINIYRTTNHNTSIIDEIKKLLVKYRELLNIEFLILLSKNEFSLHPILDLIFEDNNYSNENTIELLKYCFRQKSNGNYLIAEDKAKTKLDELLIFAQNQNSKEVFDLLELLIAEGRYKAILSDLIIEKDSDFINSLPQKLLKLAVRTFKKDNSINFANNFNFLTVIIRHGSNKQKEYVIDILIGKLGSNENIEESLNLIDTMENISSFDLSRLLYSHLDKYLRDNKETLEEEFIKRIKQARVRAKK